MIHYTVAPGTVDVTLNLFIPDASSSVGAGLTGLVYNSSGLVCYYVRPLAAAAQLTLATQTVTGAHSDGGFVEVSSANMPGVYRLDLSDAVCAVNVPSVLMMLKGAANRCPNGDPTARSTVALIAATANRINNNGASRRG